MYVYWGTDNSGKKHVECSADANSKTTLTGRYPKILQKKKVNMIYWEDKWNESETEEILYHRQKRYPDEFLQTKVTQHQIQVGFEGNSSMSDINTKTTWDKLDDMYDEKFMKFRDRRKHRLQPYLEEYGKKEYANTMIYQKLIQQNSSKICDPMGVKMLNDNAEEIFDGVDFATNPLQSDYILQGSSHWRGGTEVIPDNVVKIYQSAVNVVPYKTNLLDSVISKLDTFTDSQAVPYPTHRYIDHRTHVYDKVTGETIKKGTIYELYKHNKPFLWQYLDSYQTHLNDIISIMRQHNIPITMFNLDEDRYEDIFPDWNVVLPKDTTHFKKVWGGYEENYKEVVIMAKEYLSRREKSFQTSMKKPPKYRMV